MSEALIHAFNSRGELPALLGRLADEEVQAAGADDTLIFRANSAVTRLIEVYCRVCSPGYRRKVTPRRAGRGGGGG